MAGARLADPLDPARPGRAAPRDLALAAAAAALAEPAAAVAGGGAGDAGARLAAGDPWQRLGSDGYRAGGARLRRSGADRARPSRGAGAGVAVLEAQRDPGGDSVRAGR